MHEGYPHQPARLLLPALMTLALGIGCNTPNTPPALTSIGSQRTPMGNPVDVAFSISDETPSNVTVSASSDDPTLVADADLEPIGSGADRTLRATPSPLGLGSVNITLTATDSAGLQDTEAFRLDVTLPFQTQLSELSASDAADDDVFGVAVAIDGDYAIIGAPGDDHAATNAGSAYAFKRTGDTWNQIDKLTANDAASDDRFGHSVALDGDYAIIGAHGDDHFATNAGSAYAFKRTGDTWSQIDKLVAADPTEFAFFSVSMGMDGSHAIVGADGEGSAYAFRRTNDTWTQVDVLTANDAAGDELFGHSLAIDGNIAIIGDHRGDLGGTDEGAAYIYARSGDTWTQVDKLVATDAADFDLFGFAVAIHGDYAVIGAPGDDLSGLERGSAYIFVK